LLACPEKLRQQHGPTRRPGGNVVAVGDVALRVAKSLIAASLVAGNGNDWQGLFEQETAQARKMPRALLEGRILFTPNVEERSCVFQASGSYDELFRVVGDSETLKSFLAIHLGLVVASPTKVTSSG